MQSCEDADHTSATSSWRLRFDSLDSEISILTAGQTTLMADVAALRASILLLIEKQTSMADAVAALRSSTCRAPASPKHVKRHGPTLIPSGMEADSASRMKTLVESGAASRKSKFEAILDNDSRRIYAEKQWRATCEARHLKDKTMDERACLVTARVPDEVPRLKDWHQSLQMRECYMQIYDKHRSSDETVHEAVHAKGRPLRRVGTQLASGHAHPEGIDASQFQQSQVCLCRSTYQARILDPDSLQARVFDFLMVVPFVSDVCILPVVVAWDLPLTGFSKIVSWCSAVYWVMAFVLNFRTGFYECGELVMESAAIAQRYVKTWCLPDMILIILDFASLSIQPVPGLIRLLRLVKIIRMIRCIQLVSELASQIRTPGMRITVTAANMMIAFLLASHFLGCLLFAVSRDAETGTGKRWIDYSQWHIDPGYDFLQQALPYQYVTSVLYAGSMLTLASAYNIPPNTVEGCISIFAIITGLLLSGTVAALFSEPVMQMAQEQGDKRRLLADLDTYLEQRKVKRLKPQLARRCNRQVLSRLEIQAPLDDEEVTALEMLSAPLIKELLRTTRLPQLKSHVLLSFWIWVETPVADFLCLSARFDFSPPQDVLFEDGDVADEMFYIEQGLLSYTSTFGQTKYVHTGKWICEAALWVQNWTHTGTLEAVRNCQVLQISSKVMEDALELYPNLARHTVEYCAAFKACLEAACPPHAEYPDDLDNFCEHWKGQMESE
eukprot:TRINITY_DN33816_c0_g1_i1.p1 TRINITY_DN33816_c0_g1~~TRINITY_DN33816_c0_g1_i1.p1  ORF type:complete len:726 (-),score=95.12 TRINITY_DN33816_c0_g1_i1:117-2294(-)